MGDIEELKLLVAQKARENIASQKRVDDLIQALARADAVYVPGADSGRAACAAVVTRAEKISRLGIALRKSYKVKEFKDNN